MPYFGCSITVAVGMVTLRSGLPVRSTIPLEQHDQVRFLSMYNLHVRFLIAIFRRIRGLWHHRSFRTRVSAYSAENSILRWFDQGSAIAATLE